jgi:hypothetical protein
MMKKSIKFALDVAVNLLLIRAFESLLRKAAGWWLRARQK